LQRGPGSALIHTLDGEALLRAAWLAPFYMVGTWARAALLHRAPEEAFRMTAAGVVLLLGAAAAAL